MDEAADRIYLQGLRIACRIGARPQERSRSQEIVIDVCLHVDLEEPGRSDRLEDTADYSRLAGQITDMAESSSFQLLERLAEEVASLALADAKVQRVEVKVSKPHALPRGRAAAVQIIRDRSSSRRMPRPGRTRAPRSNRRGHSPRRLLGQTAPASSCTAYRPIRHAEC